MGGAPAGAGTRKARAECTAEGADPGALAHTRPSGGGVKDTTRPFTWTAASAAQQYSLWVGTTPGGADLAAAYVSPSTLSYDVPMLPTGRTLYARV